MIFAGLIALRGTADSIIYESFADRFDKWVRNHNGASSAAPFVKVPLPCVWPQTKLQTWASNDAFLTSMHDEGLLLLLTLRGELIFQRQPAVMQLHL